MAAVTTLEISVSQHDTSENGGKENAPSPSPSSSSSSSLLPSKLRGLDQVTKYVREKRVGPLLNGMLCYLSQEKPEDPLDGLLTYLEEVQAVAATRAEDRRQRELKHQGLNNSAEVSFNVDTSASSSYHSPPTTEASTIRADSESAVSEGGEEQYSDDFTLAASSSTMNPEPTLMEEEEEQKKKEEHDEGENNLPLATGVEEKQQEPEKSNTELVDPTPILEAEPKPMATTTAGDEANDLLRQIAENEKAFLALLQQSQAEVTTDAVLLATTGAALQPTPPRAEHPGAGEGGEEGAPATSGASPGGRGRRHRRQEVEASKEEQRMKERRNHSEDAESLKELLAALEGESHQMLAAVLSCLGE